MATSLLNRAIAAAVSAAAKNAIGMTKKAASKGKSESVSGGSSISNPKAGSTVGVDYHTQMQNAMDSGASADVVEYLMNQRNNKIAANQDHYDSLGISSQDGISQAAQQYIREKRAEQLPGVQYGDFQEFVADTGYDDYAEQVKKSIQASVDQAVNGYRGQIDTTNDQSDDMARQAWVAKRLAEKNLGQQLAAGGYAGGMADSQKISLESTYQEQLTDIEKQRLQTVQDLETAINHAKLTGDMQTAQELAGMLRQIESQWNSYVQNQQQLNRQDYWNQKQLDNQNYWNEQDLATQNRESAYTRALNLISQGFMPDDETLTTAGITRQAAQQRIDQLMAEQAEASASPAAAPRRASAGGTNQNQTAPLSGRAGQRMTYSNLLNRLNLAMSEEKPEAAEKIVSGLIDTYWDAMSGSQQEEVYALLLNYGFA